jgi:hypothetical protein
VPTFVNRGVSRGQRGGSPTVVNLSPLLSFQVAPALRICVHKDFTLGYIWTHFEYSARGSAVDEAPRYKPDVARSTEVIELYKFA